MRAFSGDSHTLMPSWDIKPVFMKVREDIFLVDKEEMVIPWEQKATQLGQNICSWIWCIDPEWYCQMLLIF